jgi:hypothetical protein
VNQGYKGGDEFDFIALEMTDHMPQNIFWKNFVFGRHFLDFVFAEKSLTGLVSFEQFFGRLGLANGNQPAASGTHLAVE